MTKGVRASVGGPIEASQRIEVIDVIRGFALFGVLLVNMHNFGAYSPIWTGAGDRVAFSLMRFFFETKSWRLFAGLFGLGFALQLVRAQARGSAFVAVYLRRLAVLFLIGAAHALLFPGDVLMVYAELGLLLLLFRSVPPRVLVVLAAVMLAVYPLGRAANTLVSGDAATTAQVVDIERARAFNDELLRTHPHAVGSFSDVVRANATVIPPNPFGQPLGLEAGLGFFAMFLVGLYVGKRGIFSGGDAGVHARVPLFRRVAIWGLSLGAVGMILERATSSILQSRPGAAGGGRAAWSLVGDLAFTYGSTALALGYAAAIVLLIGTRRLRWLLLPLAPVGRFALSVYLTQTLAFTTLFYGYGLGQAFRLGPLAVAGIALGIFIAQVAVCSWWARRFRYGPAEWLWRSLTYLRLP